METNILLIIFLGLISKLAFLCGDCDVRTSEVNNFDFTEVGIVVLALFLKQAAFITAARILI